jgi:hypothetical protein
MKAMSTSLITGSVFLASILLGSPLASATTYTYEDGDFSTATQTTIYAGSGTAATITVPCASCGNGGGAGIGVDSSGITASSAVFIGEPNWIYDPSTQGSIISISGGIDREVVNRGGATKVLRLAIEQGGNYYFTSLSYGLGSSGTWYTLSSGPLTATDFGLYLTGGYNTAPDYAMNPNFSQDFELGYLLLGQSGPTSAAFDNLNFAVTATPLPATLPLFATGLGAMGLLGWRRRRKNTPAIAA